MGAHYRCKNERRRAAVRDRVGPDSRPIVNGIDYVEVQPAQGTATLVIHFIHHIPGMTTTLISDTVPSAQELNPENVRIEGGGGSVTLNVNSVSVADGGLSLIVLISTSNHSSDLPSYTLRLVRSAADPSPPVGFDPQLSAVDISFASGSDQDCLVAPLQATPPPGPQIDYLAKDYASFRRLMLDRMAVLMPGWTETSAADVGVVLVELLAYAADHLSYYQDAVATEAYLGTARSRISVRRHARLLDYLMHDGCNARAWIAFQAGPQADGRTLPGPGPDRQHTHGTRVLTQVDPSIVVLTADRLGAAIQGGAQVFELLHDLTLYQAHNEIPLYTWGDAGCYLPKGATSATLNNRGGVLHLVPGDLLVFEEVRGPQTGLSDDADHTHRHAVRLTQVLTTQDPLVSEDPAGTQPLRLLDIEWGDEDALPFDLCLCEAPQDAHLPEDQRRLASVVHGNVALADHGATLPEEALAAIPAGGGVRYRPVLKQGPLTQQGQVLMADELLHPFDPSASASAALRFDMRNTSPAIRLWKDTAADPWLPQRDLLESSVLAQEFVVEVEQDGTAQLRFGDGVRGKVPDGNISAVYRVGNGPAGNIGAEKLVQPLLDQNDFADPMDYSALKDPQGILGARNPLPASGGTDPEPIDQVRLYAPQAFRIEERAVTDADYAAVVQRHPEVKQATAKRGWTGSWYTIFITVSRQGGLPVDEPFKASLKDFAMPFRLAGHDLQIDAPEFVGLEVDLTVTLQPDQFQAVVKGVLLQVLSNADLPNGKRGFFHPDNFDFGQTVYLSQIISTVMQVQGVAHVESSFFGRYGGSNEKVSGKLAMGRVELPRLDNNPGQPENGRITLKLLGGL